MKSAVETLSPTRVKLTVEVPAERRQAVERPQREQATQCCDGDEGRGAPQSQDDSL